MVHFEIRDLSFTYPGADRQALTDVELTIQKGEYLTLCGMSGCGKTTLLRHLKSALTPQGQRSGAVLFNGEPLEKTDGRRQAAGIGYVMQNPADQLVTDKVWHELAFGLESLGVDERTIRLRVAEMASYFGIQEWFHKDVSQLSGGQKQLLNLASVMAMQPEALLLDEPTSQLDPIAASEFLNTVRRINRELRTTVIMTEQRLEEIIPVSDRVAVMHEGRLAIVDTPERTGAYLQKKNSPLLAAMPSPMQICYSVPNPHRCPLTVREGAEWLDQLFAEKNRNVSEKRTKEELPEQQVTKRGAGRNGQPEALTLKDVWFRYGKEEPDVLKGVSLSVLQGSFHAIVGGNGTGKSTLLRAVCHLCRPYRGRVLIDGRPVNRYKGGELFENRLAMLPQEVSALFGRSSVREELEEMTDGGPDERVQRIAECCGLMPLMDRHPYDLSGGEQQRAALAKVLLTEPQILLLDEPTKGMDAVFKQSFAKLIRKLQEQGVTILMVSHDVEFCARYADAVSMFFDGAVIATDTPEHVFARNSFYTTAANRMSRHMFPAAVTNEEVIALCRENT